MNNDRKSYLNLFPVADRHPYEQRGTFFFRDFPQELLSPSVSADLSGPTKKDVQSQESTSGSPLNRSAFRAVHQGEIARRFRASMCRIREPA